MLTGIKNIFKSSISQERQAEMEEIKKGVLPRHVAIIMDGNGRWAKKRRLPRAAGHRAGMEALKKTVECCTEIGIPYLTLYAFSTENWKRPRAEVDSLMDLLVEYIGKELNALQKNGVRVKSIGRVAELPEDAQKSIRMAEEKTQGNNRLYLQIAINYGGRREIIDAVKMILDDYKKGSLKEEDVTEEAFSNYLYTGGLPDPDLVIRPSGEMRLSNFLIWQSAYAEFLATDVLWPDFGKEDLYQAIAAYQKRQRRFGGL